MSEFVQDYVVVRATTEASGTPRTLKAIIEEKLTAIAGSAVTLPSGLAVAITIRNDSSNNAKIGHLSALGTHYFTFPANTVRQLVSGTRLDLSSVYYNVGVTNDPVEIEVVFE